MKVKDLVTRDTVVESDCPFVIGEFNDETGDENDVFISWEDMNCPENIKESNIEYITIRTNNEGMSYIYFEYWIN